MGSRGNSASLALFLSLNLLFFTLVTACGTCPSPCGTCPSPRPRPTPSPRPRPTPSPRPRPTPSPSPTPTGKCPKDTLKLGVCADLLGLVNVVVGSPATTPCCSLIQGLANLEAAICLCTAIKANILGINLNIPVSLSLLLNVCGKTAPSGFQCA